MKFTVNVCKKSEKVTGRKINKKIQDKSAPAVHNNGPCVWRIEELDLADEAQQACGVAGNAVIGPAGEVELSDFPDLVVTLLQTRACGELNTYRCHHLRVTGM